MTRSSTKAVLLAVSALWTGSAPAQDAAATYPSKPVRVIVGVAPGGSVDGQARMFSQKLSELLHQPFIVENRPSGGGTAAMTAVAKAPSDGYMLLAVSPSFTVAPSMTKDLTTDPIRDFAPVSLMTKSPYLLVVHPSVPAKSVKDFIALAKARPGKLNLGGTPTGNIVQLAALWFFSVAKINVTYIPYKGTGPSIVALISGETDATMGNIISVGPHVKAGKVRALGVTSAQRYKLMPELPTFQEQGVPGYDMATFHGWIAPAGTAPAIMSKLSAELAKVVNMPDIANRLKDDGGEPVGSTPEQFRLFIAEEIPRWRKIVQDNNIKADQ